MTEPNEDEPKEEPAPEESMPQETMPQETPADGLDLARQIVKSLRGAAASQGKPQRRRQQTRPRGTTSAVSGARPDDRDPQLLESTMDRLVSDRGWEVDLRVHGVFGRWPDLVGPEVAAHATPESFAEGRLVVRTDSTAWATQLRLLAPQLVRRLNEEVGHDTVQVVEVQGPHAPSWKKGRLGLRDGRGPRDTYG